jgi:integrase
MRGSIRPKGKQSWQIQIYTGTTQDGKPRRYFETVRGRKGDAQRRMNELLVSLEKGVPIPIGRLTVAQHLDQWLEGYVKTNCGPRNYKGYQSIVTKHLASALGRLQLEELQPPVIQRYYGKACDSLSARSVHYHHRVLSQSLKYAVRQGYLGRNPCELVDPPSARKKTMRTLKPEEVGILFEAAEGNPYYGVTYAAVSSGLRQAELFGLGWRGIDLDMCSMSVQQVLFKRQGVCVFKQPKTAHSRRVSMTPKLASYRAEREAFHQTLEKPLTLDDLVFVTEDLRPIDPSVLSHAFKRLVKQAGLSGVRFHDLRHTFASLMLMRGAKPKVISEALGHSSVAFTMDTYSHIMEGMQQEAMALLDDVLPAGVSRKDSANLTPTFLN